MCRPQSALSKNNLRRPKTICVVQKQSVKTLKPRYDGLQSEIGTHEQAHIKLLVITIGELAIVAKQEPFKGCNQFYHQNLHLNLNNFFKIKNENFSFESLRNKSRSKGAINSTTQQFKFECQKNKTAMFVIFQCPVSDQLYLTFILVFLRIEN